jgi:hypothetical protein
VPDASAPEPAGPGPVVPVPLRVAALLVALEGLALVLLGVLEVVSLDSKRLTMDLTVTVFFWAFGGLLVVAAWGLSRLRPFARGPVLLAQLICLGLAWNFRHGSTLPVAIGLAVVALVVLAGLLHPRSIEALERAADRI